MPKLLIIDDSEDLCAALKEYLEGEGIGVSTAFEGESGLAEAIQGDFDVIAVDIFLPGRDGLEIIQELRQRFPKRRIIAISAGSDLDKEMCLTAARQVGADLVLPKPFSFDEFKHALGDITPPPD